MISLLFSPPYLNLRWQLNHLGVLFLPPLVSPAPWGLRRAAEGSEPCRPDPKRLSSPGALGGSHLGKTGSFKTWYLDQKITRCIVSFSALFLMYSNLINYFGFYTFWATKLLSKCTIKCILGSSGHSSSHLSDCTESCCSRPCERCLLSIDLNDKFTSN